MEMRKSFGNFSAQCFLDLNHLDIENVLVVTNKAASTEKTRQLWFTRFAVDGDNIHFDDRFGANFLWQIPYHYVTKFNKMCSRWMTAGSAATT